MFSCLCVFMYNTHSDQLKAQIIAYSTDHKFPESQLYLQWRWDDKRQTVTLVRRFYLENCTAFNVVINSLIMLKCFVNKLEDWSTFSDNTSLRGTHCMLYKM